ncbi:hypothetical protein PG996_009369 [Apiospora saccharicola]|uniref:DUF7908 domain-containing protein n=1 Tax=Apiospora saccharicola TaxID=335842 RepID=A0ABR1UKM1_9PEZI
MRVYLLLYWFLAASKFNLSGCDQQLLGTEEDARDEARGGAGSICYTYITTILVTITTDSSDTRGETTDQLPSTAASYPFDCLAQQTQTRTRGQAGDDFSSPGTLGSQENGMSNNPGHSAISTISTPDATSGARMSDESDAYSSEIPDTKTSPPADYTSSDASLGRDPTAPASSAGAILTTPGQTSVMHSDAGSHRGQDSTELRGSSTPGPPGPGFPASTKMLESNTPSGGPTNPGPTSKANTEAKSNQPASMTTQGPSSVVASQVILSIEAIASFGPASQKPQVRPRRREPSKRDDTDPGFVGDSQDPNPDSCSNAVRFRQSGGQLQRQGRAVSVDPGVDYIDLANYAGGAISTLFSVVDETLRWDNDAFYGGRTSFCQVDSETVYAAFTNAGGPKGCSPVALVVYRGTFTLAIP